MKQKSLGITLIELLIVVSLLSLIILFSIWMYSKQLARSHDANRKADLEKIRISFEDYYNDNNCYPGPEVLSSCNAGSFSPYLSSIPCDPVNKTPYLYKPLDDPCQGYRVYADLEDDTDPVISVLKCNTAQGCGFGYDYGISAGTPVAVTVAASPTPTATPRPSGVIYVFACAGYVCNRWEEGHPYLENCPKTFKSSDCDRACGDMANHCVGS